MVVQLLEERAFFLRQRRKRLACSAYNFARFVFIDIVISVVVGVVDDVTLPASQRFPATNGSDVFFQRKSECCGRGEQTLLEELKHKLTGEPLFRRGRALEPQSRVCLKRVM